MLARHPFLQLPLPVQLAVAWPVGVPVCTVKVRTIGDTSLAERSYDRPKVQIAIVVIAESATVFHYGT
jgi:hypothetical protein